jgi:hypothetical protein
LNHVGMRRGLDNTYLPTAARQGGGFLRYARRHLRWSYIRSSGSGVKPVADTYTDLLDDTIHVFNGKQVEKQFESDISTVVHPLPRVPIVTCYFPPEDGFDSGLRFFSTGRQVRISTLIPSSRWGLGLPKCSANSLCGTFFQERIFLAAVTLGQWCKSNDQDQFRRSIARTGCQQRTPRDPGPIRKW